MFKLFRKRSVWVPTWRTCLIAATLFGLVVWFVLANIHGFLSVTEPAEGAKVLVVEGWVPDHILQEVLSDFVPGEPYDYICTTGAGMARGSYLSEYKTFAGLTARTIEQLGVPKDRIIVAPSERAVKDRSYHSALAFKEKRKASEIPELRDAEVIDVLTSGVHGRRTRTVFRKVLGDKIEVGVISPDSGNYDPKKWFASSEGVKSVIIESLSVAYEWLGKKRPMTYGILAGNRQDMRAILQPMRSPARGEGIASANCLTRRNEPAHLQDPQQPLFPIWDPLDPPLHCDMVVLEVG